MSAKRIVATGLLALGIFNCGSSAESADSNATPESAIVADAGISPIVIVAPSATSASDAGVADSGHPLPDAGAAPVVDAGPVPEVDAGAADAGDVDAGSPTVDAAVTPPPVDAAPPAPVGVHCLINGVRNGTTWPLNRVVTGCNVDKSYGCGDPSVGWSNLPVYYEHIQWASAWDNVAPVTDCMCGTPEPIMSCPVGDLCEVWDERTSAIYTGTCVAQ